jgi:NADH-quinone oxidoreductase subunit J
MITLPQIIFGYFAFAILVLSGMAVNNRNPVHSVLLVLLMFFHIAGVYLMLNAEFLAAVQVIVYAGAILVLYLFVLFLVNLREEVVGERFVKNHASAAVFTVGIFATLVAGIQSFKLGPKDEWTIEAIKSATHTKALGQEIFTNYMLPFEIAGTILLVAVIGAMVLVRREKL